MCRGHLESLGTELRFWRAGYLNVHRATIIKRFHAIKEPSLSNVLCTPWKDTKRYKTMAERVENGLEVEVIFRSLQWRVLNRRLQVRYMYETSYLIEF